MPRDARAYLSDVIEAPLLIYGPASRITVTL